MCCPAHTVLHFCQNLAAWCVDAARMRCMILHLCLRPLFNLSPVKVQQDQTTSVQIYFPVSTTTSSTSQYHQLLEHNKLSQPAQLPTAADLSVVDTM